MKYNPMFSLRSTNEMKECYKNPSVIVGAIALILVIISFFVPYFVQPNSVSVKIENLLHSGFKDVILITTIINAVLVLATLIFSIIFKNTTKLSALTMIFGGIVLISVVFQLLYCTKIGFSSSSGVGTTVANFSLTFGSLCVILAALLIVGIEFYKLGWQGYEVKDEKENNEESNDKVETEQTESEQVEHDVLEDASNESASTQDKKE